MKILSKLTESGYKVYLNNQKFPTNRGAVYPKTMSRNQAVQLAKNERIVARKKIVIKVG